ncbi:hypothetical protein IJI55_03515 [Candidatus Saccharibacteria bacterium]|nr:hypothetical protein [Candidatus Saccharibacteria bacterium]MBR0403583.1 hypothetical protein [Candidatus Saccharibacteria bacterium]
MDKMTKRLIKEATRDSGKGDFFHSSGYAKAQAGAHIGAASSQSFKQRQKMAREFVGRYDDAQLNRDTLSYQADGLRQTAAQKSDEPSIGAQRWADIKAASAQGTKNAAGGGTSAKNSI